VHDRCQGRLRHSSRTFKCGAARDFAAEDMRVGWSSATTLDLRDEMSVCSTHSIGLRRGDGNGKLAYRPYAPLECLQCVRVPTVLSGTNRGHGIEQIPQRRRCRTKGGVLAEMYVGCQSERERQEYCTVIRNLEGANGHIRVDMVDRRV
jgi:hypothetical protein